MRHPENKDGTLKILHDDKYYFFEFRTPHWNDNKWQRDWMRYDKAKRLDRDPDYEVRWCEDQEKPEKRNAEARLLPF